MATVTAISAEGRVRSMKDGIHGSCAAQGWNCPNQRKKQTNGDRIHSMSDEELALFLCNIHEPDEDTIVIDDKEFFAETEILEWLQSEVEE